MKPPLRRIARHDILGPCLALPAWAGARRQGPTASPRGTRLALVVMTLAALALAACAPHAGGDEVAFLRGGQLWTVNSDGSDALAIAGGNVAGFAWSPDHHQLVFRYGGKAAPTGIGAAAPDAPGLLGVVGVDGGAAVTITPEVAGLARSDAWWDAQGNRLLYREGFPLAPGVEPTSVLYELSQADQPAGIARKTLLDAAGIPALAPDGSQIAVVDPEGIVRVGAPGQAGRAVAGGALLTLPGGSRPARVLWQPQHQALLYAAAAQHGEPQAQLMLADLRGHARAVGTAHALLDYAFSPDGSLLLVHTAADFQVWDMRRAGDQLAAFSWREDDPMALAWWSPDGRRVLVRDRAGLVLADVRARRIEQLLAGGRPEAEPGAGMSWRPLAGSPWSADGSKIVFADSGTGSWLGHALPAARRGGGGLYAAGVGGGAGVPELIASGSIAWPSWSYLDPNASFLAAS
jgi:hypothetical protein